MNHYIVILISLVLVICDQAHCAAEDGDLIKFERKTATAAPKPYEEFIDVSFPFVNEAKVPVDVDIVKSSCNCLTAAPDKTVYAPGEHGIITMRFNVGDYEGTLLKTADVKLTRVEPAGAQQTITLTLEVGVKPLVKITPRRVSWKIGDVPDAKHLKVSMEDADAILSDAKVNDDAFTIDWSKSVKNDKLFILAIIPSKTSEELTSVVSITCTFPNGMRKMRTVFLTVDK